MGHSRQCGWSLDSTLAPKGLVLSGEIEKHVIGGCKSADEKMERVTDS